MIDFKKFREDTGLSQSEFSKLFKIPLKSIQNWEYGRTTPPPYLLPMIQIIFENQLLSDLEGAVEHETL